MDAQYPELPDTAIGAFTWKKTLCWRDCNKMWATLPEDRKTIALLEELEEVYWNWKWLEGNGRYDPSPETSMVRFVSEMVGGTDLWLYSSDFTEKYPPGALF